MGRAWWMVIMDGPDRVHATGQEQAGLQEFGEPKG